MRRFLCLTAMLLLSGCGGEENGGANGDGEPITVAFVTNNPYEFWTYARRGTEKAAEELGVEVEFQMPARGTAAEQRQIVEDLLSKGVDGIAISPNDAANQAAFLNEIAEQIPLVTQDSDLPPGSRRWAYIGTDNYKAGQAAGELVKEAMPEGGKLVIYVGKLDVQNAVERRQGLLDYLAGEKDAEGPTYGDYELLDTMTDDAKQERCKQNVEDSLTKYNEHLGQLCLVGLWAYNPPAILAAVQDANLEGKVPIVGFDENDETLQGIADGHIHGTIVQQPFEFGYQAVKMLTALAKGDRSVIPENEILYIPHRVVRQDNVDAFREEIRKLKSG